MEREKEVKKQEWERQEREEMAETGEKGEERGTSDDQIWTERERERRREIQREE